MKSFISAFRETILTQFIEGTTPYMVWFSDDKAYRVTWYYNKETIKRIGGEIIL
jgi:hypothetical protein